MEYLPEPQRHAVKFRMRAAYLMDNLADAKNALFQLHDELMNTNPSAAGSLAEGLDDTLTVLDLRIQHKLRQALSCTNGIESGFSTVSRICLQVKRWQVAIIGCAGLDRHYRSPSRTGVAFTAIATSRAWSLLWNIISNSDFSISRRLWLAISAQLRDFIFVWSVSLSTETRTSSGGHVARTPKRHPLISLRYG